MRLWIMLAISLCSGAAVAVTQDKRDTEPGALLYSTYCIGCHTEQAHWRDKKLATDWASLIAETERWQTNSGLNWGKDDIENVARYLNKLHYHYPTPN